MTSMEKFLSTPSLRRATGESMKVLVACEISIHALLAEGDALRNRRTKTFSVISIHALLAEGDARRHRVSAGPCLFLSTPSLRRATNSGLQLFKAIKFLSTPSLRRATLTRIAIQARREDFYPRPPCGGRPSTARLAANDKEFYPRPPCGGRQRTMMPTTPPANNFYPRPPCGGRLSIFLLRVYL